jgi:hypothetical protein
VPLENLLAFSIQDAQRHRPGRKGQFRGGDDRVRQIERLDFDLAEDR